MLVITPNTSDKILDGDLIEVPDDPKILKQINDSYSTRVEFLKNPINVEPIIATFQQRLKETDPERSKIAQIQVQEALKKVLGFNEFSAEFLVPLFDATRKKLYDFYYQQCIEILNH